MFWRKKRSSPTTNASRSDHEQQETDAASSQTEAGPQTSEPAVFEFGRRTSDGLVMQGVCKTELDSDIPACIWRVADAADFKQAPQNAPKYHIEF
ncbi:hypothetical protein WJX77_012434 [Trebouxia sp. C0004]